jgi:molybdopterin molybdotransferase
MESMESLPRPEADVRMRGFATRATVAAALAWVDQHALPLSAETVPLAECAGRILAKPVVSSVAVPSFARSMMDGYAVRADDTLGAGQYNRLPLAIVGEALPGRPFAGEVAAQQAVRIMTGAPLPCGADAVLPAEVTEAEGGTVFALDSVSPGKNVGQVGEDVVPGAVVLASGRRLRPQDVGLLSAIGQSEIEVVRRPVVALVITGNELLPAGTRPAGCSIADANGPMLDALVRRDGGVPRSLGIVADDPQSISAAMQTEADVVLVSGGSSVGMEDHAPRILAELGKLALHGIAMRPSSPTAMGRIGNKLVFLLPGNPVSCLCAYDFFAGRAIRRLGGCPSQWPYRRERLPLGRKLVSQVGRVDYARVRVSGGLVEPVAISGASLLSSTVVADGFVVLEADSEGLPAGAEVDVWFYDA